MVLRRKSTDHTPEALLFFEWESTLTRHCSVLHSTSSGRDPEYVEMAKGMLFYEPSLLPMSSFDSSREVLHAFTYYQLLETEYLGERRELMTKY